MPPGCAAPVLPRAASTFFQSISAALAPTEPTIAKDANVSFSMMNLPFADQAVRYKRSQYFVRVLAMNQTHYDTCVAMPILDDAFPQRGMAVENTPYPV